MNILGIIPARYASTRFPGKPLIDIAGKSMIQRVYEQATKAVSLHKVIIATDDERILDHVQAFGGNAQLTATHHPSGTDRCAEVAQQHPEFDVIINIQGDEPFINPSQIDLLASCFTNTEVQIATLVKKISTTADLDNPNLPKVVLSHNNRAIYFSRSPVPYLRGVAKENWLNTHAFHKHIGMYGYNRGTLLMLAQLQATLLEETESLEQLRWIDNGYAIYTAKTDIETVAIDTPEDLEKALQLLGNT